LNPIRPLALAQVEKNLPDFRIHVNVPKPTAFGLIENDQAAEKINLSNFQTQLLTLRAPVPIANGIMVARCFRLPQH